VRPRGGIAVDDAQPLASLQRLLGDEPVLVGGAGNTRARRVKGRSHLGVVGVKLLLPLPVAGALLAQPALGLLLTVAAGELLGVELLPPGVGEQLTDAAAPTRCPQPLSLPAWSAGRTAFRHAAQDAASPIQAAARSA
jgi:hypothetical protein